MPVVYMKIPHKIYQLNLALQNTSIAKGPPPQVLTSNKQNCLQVQITITSNPLKDQSLPKDQCHPKDQHHLKDKSHQVKQYLQQQQGQISSTI